jgi:broad specificity phosphatase PhoE
VVEARAILVRVSEPRGPEVVVVRHGQTEWSVAGRHTGRTDVPLTEDGRREAARLALAPALADRAFALVLTSPRQRARETCALAGFGVVAQVDEDLCEWDYGEYEGRTTVAIREQRPGWSLWTDGVPGGEDVAAVGTRADRVIRRLRAANGDALVFAHAHVLRVLAARWVALPPVDGMHFALEPARPSTLGYEREIAVIREWNLPVT